MHRQGRHPPVRRAPRRPVGFTTSLTTAVSAVLALQMSSVTTALPAHADHGRSTAVALVDDAGGALFDVRRMVPGDRHSACVAITVAGTAGENARVTLVADIADDGLAPYLKVGVDVASEGSHDNCGEFDGLRIWDGALADMPSDPNRGIDTGWRPARTGRVVFRFTVELIDDPRAEGRSARADFRWTLLDGTGPVPHPTPTASPATPSTRPPVGDTPPPRRDGDRATERPTPPTRPVPQPSRTDDGTGKDDTSPREREDRPRKDDDRDGPPAAGGRGPDGVVEAPPIQAEGTIDKLVATAAAIARNGHFPLLLLLVLVAFLGFQGLLDRRDPKLTLARVREDLRAFHDFPEHLGNAQ